EVRIKGHFDIKGIILMSVGSVFFMLFTTSDSISFLIVSVLSFLILVKHIRKVTDPFVDPGLGKHIPFMIGVLCGGIIFGTVAGLVSMVPFMFLDVCAFWVNYSCYSSRVCVYGLLYDERCTPAKYCRHRKCNYFPWNNECHYFRQHWWDTC